MAPKDIVVLGASAGGIEALRKVAGGLLRDLPASLFVVIHQPPWRKSMLPELLQDSGPLPARHAADGERIEQGRIYVAPSDHHMLLEDGYVRITRGPKENRFRPAVDPLFRSAAYVYGPRTVGVVLSGALDDGTAGLHTIKLRGGTAVVQDPADAAVDAMPVNALKYTEADHTLPAAEIGALLGRLAREPAADPPRVATDESEKTRGEIRIAEGRNALQEDIARFGRSSAFTCPDCRGVLTQLKDGGIVRYRCHTGHALARETLLASIAEKAEESLYGALRALDEAVMLLQGMAEDLAHEGDREGADRLLARARAVQAGAQPVRAAAQADDALSPPR